MKCGRIIVCVGLSYAVLAFAAGQSTPAPDPCAVMHAGEDQLRARIAELRAEISYLRSRLNGAPDTDAEPVSGYGEPKCLADGYELHYVVRRQNVCSTQQLPIGDSGETETVPSSCEMKNVQVPTCRFNPSKQ